MFLLRISAPTVQIIVNSRMKTKEHWNVKNKLCFALLCWTIPYTSMYFFLRELHDMKFNQFRLSFSISIIYIKGKSKRQLILNSVTMYFLSFVKKINSVRMPKTKWASSPTLNIFNLKCSPYKILHIFYFSSLTQSQSISVVEWMVLCISEFV